MSWGPTYVQALVEPLKRNKREVRKETVLQNGGRMENQEAGRGLETPYGLALGPTDKTRPLNIRNRKSEPYTFLIKY